MEEEEGERRRRYAADEEDRGGGGKLHIRTVSRSRSATPYDRPPRATLPAAAKSNKSGWFSKLLVKPASKILHLFPSKNQDQDHDQQFVVGQEGATVSTLISDNQKFEPGESSRHPKLESRGNECVGGTCDGSGIAEIEQQLQAKKFSRDETNHLLELLRSRTTNLPEENGQAVGLNASQVMLGQNDFRRPTKDYGVNFGSQMTPKASNKFIVNDGGCSPIDIAKAYMEGRASTSSYGGQSGGSKNEKNSIYTDSSAKSPLCWPGAIVQSDNGYSTPRRGSILSRPQTPYSGSLFSKSTSKFSGNVERANHSPRERSSSHVFGRNMRNTRMNSDIDDCLASATPVHNIFQKTTASTSKRGGSSNLATSVSLRSHSSDTSSSLSSSFERKLEPGSSKGGFSIHSTPVHPQSSELARKILEHLDRAVPSPKEKLLEITLARKRVPPKSITLTTDGQHERRDMSISNEKSDCSLTRDVVSQEIVDSQKIFSGQPTGTSSEKLQLSALPQYNNKIVSGLFQNSAASNSASQIPNDISQSSHQFPFTAAYSTKELKSSVNDFSLGLPPLAATSAAISGALPAHIMTLQSVTGTKSEAGEESIPSFKFGSSDSEPCDRLVFTFGSTANSSSTDIQTPDFKFGTGKKPDLSFQLIGANGICS